MIGALSLANYERIYEMDKQVILITGASSGFGKITALRMIADGFTVYGAARRIELMQDLVEKGGYSLKMDVTDQETVESSVNQIIQREGRIDVLVNNAGYAEYGLIETTPLEAVKRQFEVNVFGLISVTQAVLPHMRSQGHGRIVNLSSIVGEISMPLGGWYAGTKHAVEAISDSLRQEVKEFGIDVSIIEPGVFDTGFEAAADKSLSSLPESRIYKNLTDGFRKGFSKMYASAPSPEPVMKAIIHASTSKRPKTRYHVGTDSKLVHFIKPIVSDRLFDTIMKSQMGN